MTSMKMIIWYLSEHFVEGSEFPSCKSERGKATESRDAL